MISTVDRNGDGRISYSEFRWKNKCENEDRNLLHLKGCLNIARLILFYCLFYTGTINSGPLIYSPNHAEMMLWIPGGLRQVIIRNFQFEPRQFEEMFNPIKFKKKKIHNIYQGWWWAPSRWSSRRTRWWRWRLLRRPTNAFFKKTAQTRETNSLNIGNLLSESTFTSVFSLLFRFSNFKIYLQLQYDRENLSFANINPLSNTFIENNKEQSIFVRCIIKPARWER